MISQMLYKNRNIVQIVVALCGTYLLLSLFLKATEESVWSRTSSYLSQRGIRDEALDHVLNETLGVSNRLVYFAYSADLTRTNAFL